MMCIYSLLSLQCITGRFSDVAFLSFFGERKTTLLLCFGLHCIFLVIKAKLDQISYCFSFNFSIVWTIFWPISWEDWSHQTDQMGMKTPCLGAHSGSLNKTLLPRTHNLGASVRQKPWLMRNGIWQVLIYFNWFCKCVAFLCPWLRKKFDCVDAKDCGNDTKPPFSVILWTE